MAPLIKPIVPPAPYVREARAGSATLESMTNIVTTSRYLHPRSHLLLGIPLQISVGAGLSSPSLILTSENHALHHQEDEQAEDFTSELARPSIAYSPNADAESLQSGTDQRTMLSEMIRLSVVLLNLGTAPIP